MKVGVVNKSTTVNRFVLHILQRNITHLAVITRKTNIKHGILKGGLEKSHSLATVTVVRLCFFSFCKSTVLKLIIFFEICREN